MKTIKHPEGIAYCRCNNGGEPWPRVTQGIPVFFNNGEPQEHMSYLHSSEVIIVINASPDYLAQGDNYCSHCGWYKYIIMPNPYLHGSLFRDVEVYPGTNGFPDSIVLKRTCIGG